MTSVVLVTEGLRAVMAALELTLALGRITELEESFGCRPFAGDAGRGLSLRNFLDVT